MHAKTIQQTEMKLTKSLLSTLLDIVGGLFGGSASYYGDVALEWNRVALQANILDHNGPLGDGGGGRKLYWAYAEHGGPATTQGPPGSGRALASE